MFFVAQKVLKIRTAGKKPKTIFKPLFIFNRHRQISNKASPQKPRSVFQSVLTQPFFKEAFLKAKKKKQVKQMPFTMRIFLNKAGNSLNGKSGKNMKRVGNKDKAPILIPAESKAAQANPIKLSRANKGKQFSGKECFIIIELKNNKKQDIPATAHKAVTGLGK